MIETPRVSSDRVMAILEQDPISKTYLRAAIAEATVEVLKEQLAEALSKPAAGPPPEIRHG